MTFSLPISRRRAGLGAASALSLLALLLAPSAGIASAASPTSASKTTTASPTAAVNGVAKQCFAASDNHLDPGAKVGEKPTNPVWVTRDTVDQYCAALRLRDQADSPAYGTTDVTLGTSLWADQLAQQIRHPDHVHGGVTTLVPGSQAADAFRGIHRWKHLTGGRVKTISFTSSDGALLRGHVFLPPASYPRPKAGYPGIVITDGSVQAYEQLYFWAAEGLAQYGYEVMTYDVQGQGDSDLLPAECTPAECPGVPYQQSYNFYQGAEDSLNYFDSAKSPGYRHLDIRRLGIAGHSLGAAAVSWVSQCDRRVDAVVAWDDLQPIDPKRCAAEVKVPKRYRSHAIHAPALATTQDYEFNVQPQPVVPDPHGGVNSGGGAGDSGFLQVAKAGVDSQIVSFRNGTHLTYSYIPLLLPSNQLSERFAFHYTLAWFDRYLRGTADPYTKRSAYARLTGLGRYDQSADRNRKGVVSIGTGTYDVVRAAAHPTDPAAGNVAYRVAGIPIRNSLSYYFYSEYSLTDPATGTVHRCSDMLSGCPRKQPEVP